MICSVYVQLCTVGQFQLLEDQSIFDHSLLLIQGLSIYSFKPNFWKPCELQPRSKTKRHRYKKDNSMYVNDYDSNSKFDEIIVKGEHKVIILF